MTATQAGSAEQVSVETFKAPRPKSIARPDCERPFTASRLKSGVDYRACDALLGGAEGWVELGFMVDRSGKPFEITIIRSTGNKMFEKVATRAVERSTFEPGSQDGTPIESGSELKYKFVNLNLADNPGATVEFVRAYEAVMKAIVADDRPAADAAMAKLRVTNLYEDAYLGLATYGYASKWGDESQRLAGLRRAIAEEDVAYYLPRDLFRSALLASITLELNARDYAGAITTWKRLEKLSIEKSTEAQLRPVIEQLESLRSDGTAYPVSGLMTPEGQWHFHLFKRHFQALIGTGYISQVKLRCSKGYVFFAFDPKLEYEVASKYGDCWIELDGSPGTEFELIQF